MANFASFFALPGRPRKGIREFTKHDGDAEDNVD